MLIRGDARAIPLRDGCVDCVVTSPPYFGLRDYGCAQQIGLESSPAAYVEALVDVFREVWRVLRMQATCWLNLADSYCSTAPGTMGDPIHRKGLFAAVSERRANASQRYRPETPDGLKPKDLLGIPWRVAFALQAAGWYLRADIVWAKPNPMPESVTDRPTKSHEYLFLLTKAERYFYDAAAIAEPSLYLRERSDHGFTKRGLNDPMERYSDGVACCGANGTSRNKRSVWTVNTEPYAGAHFAVMPEALVEPCILAGCPPGGLVLDPFCGTGTVLRVAERLDRRGVGLDLAYQDLAKARTAQRGLRFTEVSA